MDDSVCDEKKFLSIDNPTTKDIMNALFENKSSVNKKISQLSSEMKHISKQTDASNLKLEKLATDLKKLTGEILENQNEIKNVKTELDVMKEELKKSANDLNYILQKNIENQIIISGIPVSIKSYDHAINAIKQHISVDLDHISTHYMKSSRSPNSTRKYNFINLKFKTVEQKELFMQSVRSKGVLMSNQVFSNAKHEEGQIFIREKLTSYNSKLLNELLLLRKKGKISQVWYRNCNLHIRIKPDDNATTIKSAEEIKNILSK